MALPIIPPASSIILSYQTKTSAGPLCTACSGQLIPDSILRFSSAATGEMLPLNV